MMMMEEEGRRERRRERITMTITATTTTTMTTTIMMMVMMSSTTKKQGRMAVMISEKTNDWKHFSLDSPICFLFLLFCLLFVLFFSKIVVLHKICYNGLQVAEDCCLSVTVVNTIFLEENSRWRILNTSMIPLPFIFFFPLQSFTRRPLILIPGTTRILMPISLYLQSAFF